MELKQKLTRQAVMQVYDYLNKDFEGNLPKVVQIVEKMAPKEYSSRVEMVKRAIIDEGEDNNWYRLVRSIWFDIDPGVRDRAFVNFFIRGNFDWAITKKKIEEREGIRLPWTILIDPTTACNLKCTGCWAASYGHSKNLSYEELSGIIRQGKELGMHVYLFSGGEPMVRKADIIKLCEQYPDCEFGAFTNGTLIDEQFANDMLRVQNFIPIISVEGFEKATDSRRGEGVFRYVVKAMKLLREKKLPFGVSCCYTSANVDSISSEEYFDWMVDSGAKFAWFFTYMPVGKDATKDLLASAEDRKKMYDAIRKFRNEKAIFTIDFWNDGEFTNGCIAGGKHYLHINAAGDVEPCAFIHYSDSNIRDKSLLDCLKGSLFRHYRAAQPFSDNLLRPCPFLDNPGALAKIVDESGAVSTDYQEPENIHESAKRTVEVAEAWKKTADELWAETLQRKPQLADKNQSKKDVSYLKYIDGADESGGKIAK